MNRKTYESLNYRPKLIKDTQTVTSANGSLLSTLGTIQLDIKISGFTLTETFLVVESLNRNLILGMPFLTKNGVRLYYDLKKMRLNNVYVDLESDVHISSISRISKTTVLRPRTIYLIQAQLKKTDYFDTQKTYQIEKLQRGFLADQPEIEITPSLMKLRNGRFFPVQIVNNSNKFIKLKRGCLLGAVTALQDINSIEADHRPLKKPISNEDFCKQINVHEEHKQAVTNVLLQYKDRFAFSDLDLDVTDLVEADVDTGDAQPISLRPYRVPLADREMVMKTIDEQLEAGLIERSYSPWSFPIVLVDKKADEHNPASKRMCIDFRALNAVTKVYSYPMPLIDDVLAGLRGATYYTTLDLRSGFYQVKLTERSIPKCTFSCFYGKFSARRLVFGLVNAPSVFSNLANKLLTGLEAFSCAYIDDILIWTKSDIQDHLKHVQIVMDRLRRHHLKLKLSKCHFAKEEIKYLGYVVNRFGIKPDDDKVKAIRNMATPTTCKQIRSFIGMVSWYSKVIPYLADISAPLIALTKKYARFKWTDQCQQAFDKLKESLTSVPLLAFPDPTKGYTLYTDASETAIGAVLVQKCDGEEWVPGIPNEKPVYFLSRKLNPSQQKSLNVSEKELYAMYFSLNKLDYYLHGAKSIEIACDHEPLKYLFTAEHKNRRIEAWSLMVSSYPNTTIRYLKGTDNIMADLLSRAIQEDDDNPIDPEQEVPDINDNTFQIDVLNSNRFDPKKYTRVDLADADQEVAPLPNLEDFNIIEEQAKDEDLARLKKKLQEGRADKQENKRFMIVDDVLYYISQVDDDPTLRLYIPKALQHHVIEQYHHSNGHMGLGKTFDAIKIKYYWPGLYKHLHREIDHCITCKTRNMKPNATPIQMTGTPPFPMATVAIDLSGPYRRTLSNNEYICTFICTLTGFVEAWAIPDKSTQSVVELLLEEFIPKYGCCLSCVTDNGKEFTSQMFTDTLKSLNITHIKTSFYSPQSNGVCERSHRSLHDLISKLTQDQSDTWDLHLGSALLALRTNVSKTTQKSPFFLLYNRDPVLPIDNLLKPRRKYHGEDFHKVALENHHKAFIELMKLTRSRKEKNLQRANKNRTKIDYQVGDHVYYRNHRKNNKLEQNWHTHHIVAQKTGPLSYVIQNQLTNRLIKCHAHSLRKANVEWKIPNTTDKEIRRTLLAATPPPDDDSSSSSSESSADSDDTIFYDVPSDLPKVSDADDLPDHTDDRDDRLTPSTAVADTRSPQPVRDRPPDAMSDSEDENIDSSWTSRSVRRQTRIRHDSDSADEAPSPLELRRLLNAQPSPDDVPRDDQLDMDVDTIDTVGANIPTKPDNNPKVDKLKSIMAFMIEQL